MEPESVKEYTNILLGIANKVRLLEFEFKDSRIVEKILVTVPERYEATSLPLKTSRTYQEFLWLNC